MRFYRSTRVIGSGSILMVSALAAMLANTRSYAADTLPDPVVSWYEALRTDNRALIADLLSQDAVIDLRDLGVIQTRDEFIDSLDAWEEANEGAEIMIRPAEGEDGLTAVEVCYRFPSNEVLVHEEFTLENDRITSSAQEQIGEVCDGF